MSVPPRTTRRWQAAGARPTEPAPQHKPDKLGLGLVGVVLLAIVVAAVLLIVL
jgi:hypothetical protein